MYKRVNEKFGGSEDLENIFKKLLSLNKASIVNSSHLVLELILSAYLVNKGFKVYTEVEVPGGITDIYAIKGVDMSIEVETGYVPPTNIFLAEEYLMSRIASKTVRYSNIAQQFYIAVPSFYIPPIPKELLVNPERRSESDVRKIMMLIRKYTKSPDITLNDVKVCRLNGIITINTKNLDIKIIDPKSYLNIEEFYSNVKENE
ncbi:hypothetical protein SUSAZ_01095 [Sulfolobus acidocaldarius SUSAZ]|nr:hypothetical protein SUSAZ_01095 [Sulfolobus acidocaldarius SUSAZ]